MITTNDTATDDGTTYDRDGDELKAYEVQPGQVYVTSGGERVEIVHDEARGRGTKVLEVRYPEREQLDADGNIVTATALMSRYSFADMATFDGFTLVEEDADLGHETEPAEEMPPEDAEPFGEFVETPHCPICGSFMSCRTADGREYDGVSLPSAVCTRLDCHGMMDDNELIRDGHFEECSGVGN